jgi:hypothetical protein
MHGVTIVLGLPMYGGSGNTDFGLMDKLVARLNIEHFRQRLAEEQDEVKRRTLLDLLEQEEKKLRNLLREEVEKAGDDLSFQTKKI